MKIGLFCGLALLFCFAVAANEYTSLQEQERNLISQISRVDSQRERAVAQFDDQIGSVGRDIDNPLRWFVFSLRYNLSLKDEQGRLSDEREKTRSKYNNEKKNLETRLEDVRGRLRGIRYQTTVYMTGVTLHNIPAYDSPSGQTDLRIRMRGNSNFLFEKDYCGSYFTGSCYEKIGENDVLDIQDADKYPFQDMKYEDITQISIGVIIEKALKEDSNDGIFSGKAATGKKYDDGSFKFIRFEITYRKVQ